MCGEKHVKHVRHEKKNSPKYDDWKANHNCPVNHKGSAGSMEASGALSIFRRSAEKNKLRYKMYIGDGDSKAYEDVAEAKPYKDLEVVKGECIGHVQKRVGSRLRNLKATKTEKLSDGKPLGGKGRLTEKVMNTLQNNHGMAIRQNTGNLYGMKKAIVGVLYHCCDIKDQDTRHQFCPRNAEYWCKYQSDKVTGKKTYKAKLSLPL